MRGHVPSLLFLAGLAGAAHAEELRVAARPPLSSDRLRDAVRSYVDEVVTVVDSAACQDPSPAPAAGQVFLCLGSADLPEARALRLVGVDETVVARFPTATRDEDLYRAAALKTQGVLSRRGPPARDDQAPLTARGSADPAGDHLPAVGLDLGAAWFVPRHGSAQGALKLGLAIPRGALVLGLGAYLLAAQSTAFQALDIQRRDLPVYASVAYSPLRGRFRPSAGLIFQGAFRFVEASDAAGQARSDTAFSPRLGVGAGALVAVSPWYAATLRLSGIWALADQRYLVDGQTALPAGGATLLLEIGLVSPGW